MPFLLALILTILIFMQATELPVLLIWIYWIASLIFPV